MSLLADKTWDGLFVLVSSLQMKNCIFANKTMSALPNRRSTLASSFEALLTSQLILMVVCFRGSVPASDSSFAAADVVCHILKFKHQRVGGLGIPTTLAP